MWKLWNKLFGFDYILWRNTADTGIARVYGAADGRCWYVRYAITGVIDEVLKKEQVIWLTCKPEKYLK
jgi:hypothetical protein